MENLYSTFRKLKERISPTKSKNDAVESTANTRKRRHSTSEDPFNDKVKLKGLEGEGVEGGAEFKQRKMTVKDSAETTRFIRNRNISLTKAANVQVKEVANVSFHESSEDGKPPVSEEEEGKRSGDVEEVEGIELMMADEDSDDTVPLDVLEDMNKLEECFPILTSDYRLLDKIGEGTFSTVYKAESLNGTIRLGSDLWKSPPLKHEKTTVKPTKKKHKNPMVALKQIYVTSSPSRIYNELNLLYILSGNSHVAPLLDILRYQDQVLAILPYYHHADFRDFYRDLPIKGIKKYLWELFHALSFVHDKKVIHRDLKPTNFLYDPFKGKGVLVDFGLAERLEESGSHKNSNNCPCGSKEKSIANRSYSKRLNIKAAYPKQDQRPPRRANRAGTRGFRAPEVLFKCTNQSTKLDIWSAGIIGLSLLTRKFPLFNSPDDTDALLELSLIFGIEKLQTCAEIHGCGLEINLSYDIKSNGNLIKVIADFLRYEWENESLPSDSVVVDTLSVLNENGESLQKPDLTNTNDDYESIKTKLENYSDHKYLIQLLYGCFHMDPKKRLSAKEVLKLPFFKEFIHNQEDDVLL